MIYGYCRCSTIEGKQDVNRQKRELKSMGVSDSCIYMEYESGTKVNRPELMKLLNTVQTGDTIATTEISRITRSTKQLCDIIELVKEKHLKLIIKDSITIDCTDSKQIDAMSNAFLQIAAVFAELERNMICDRVKSGMNNARAKGVKLGRPALTVDKIPTKVVALFERYREKQISKTEYAKLCDISRPTLNKYISILTDK
ncbi:MAG: recombinase family protein [Ruminococcus sp.]|nr:recombinase family protein [Ruminococcus sp.]